MIADAAGVPVYIVHTSSEQAGHVAIMMARLVASPSTSGGRE